MGRKPRIDVPNAVQHVIATANPGRRVAHDDHDRTSFLVGLAHTAASFRWDVNAWCLMDTHVHLLVHCREANLGRGMGRLLGAYARRFNERNHLSGHLWRERYYASLVDIERYLVQAAVYIVLNPVRAGLGDHPRDCSWCSYRSTSGEEPATDCFAADLLLATLGREPAVARRKYALLVDEEARRVVRARGRRAGGTAAGDGTPVPA